MNGDSQRSAWRIASRRGSCCFPPSAAGVGGRAPACACVLGACRAACRRAPTVAPFWRGGRSVVARSRSGLDSFDFVCTRVWKCQGCGVNLRGAPVSASPSLVHGAQVFPAHWTGWDGSASGLPWSPSCLPTRQLTRTGTSFSVAAQQDVPQAGARATLPLCAPRSPAHTPAARGGSDVSSCPALVGGRGCASLVHTALERRTSGLGRTSSPAGLGNAVRKEGGGGRVATAAWMPDSAGCRMGTRAGSRAPACFWC